jgi:hypothetical protein
MKEEMDDEIFDDLLETTEFFRTGLLTFEEMKRLDREERIKKLAEEARVFPVVECPSCKKEVSYTKQTMIKTLEKLIEENKIKLPKVSQK